MSTSISTCVAYEEFNYFMSQCNQMTTTDYTFEQLKGIKSHNISFNLQHTCCNFGYDYNPCKNIVTNDYVCSDHSNMSIKLKGYQYNEKVVDHDVYHEDDDTLENTIIIVPKHVCTVTITFSTITNYFTISCEFKDFYYKGSLQVSSIRELYKVINSIFDYNSMYLYTFLRSIKAEEDGCNTLYTYDDGTYSDFSDEIYELRSFNKKQIISMLYPFKLLFKNIINLHLIDIGMCEDVVNIIHSYIVY